MAFSRLKAVLPVIHNSNKKTYHPLNNPYICHYNENKKAFSNVSHAFKNESY